MMNEEPWTADTPIERIWTCRSHPRTPEEFLDWLHQVTDEARRIGGLFHGDATHNHHRLAMKAWEVACDIRIRHDDPPALPERATEPEMVLLDLQQWATSWVRDREVARRPPLSGNAATIYDMLLDLPPNQAMTGPEIIERLAREHHVPIEQSTLTSHIVPILKAWGVENIRRRGYRIKR